MLKIEELDGKGCIVQWNALNVLVLTDFDYYLSIYSIKKGKVVKLPRSSYLVPYVYAKENWGDTEAEIVRHYVPRSAKEFLIGFGTYYIGVIPKDSDGEVQKLYRIEIGLEYLRKKTIPVESVEEAIVEAMKNSFLEWKAMKEGEVRTVV